MIATQLDIMASVESIELAKQALQLATQARRVAQDALNAAYTVEEQANLDYQLAQNALLVAAGGTDRSFLC